MAQPNPAPNQTKSFVLGIVASIVVVALALAFVMRRGAQNTAPAQQAPAVETAAAPATEPPVAPIPEYSEEQIAAVPRISVDNMLKQAPNGIVVVDVRDADAYLAAHIDGALHIPAQYLQGEMPYLPKDKPIITYCT